VADIVFTTRLTEADWDDALRGWRCPPLAVPGAIVEALFIDGNRIDAAKYEVLLQHAWQASVEYLTADARELLERLAWLAPAAVPEALLDVPVPGLQSEGAQGALADLATYSLITREAETPRFRMHQLQATNRLSEAEPLIRRALAIDEASLGPAHPAVARDLSNLASLLKFEGRIWDAEPLVNRALAINSDSLGPDHPKGCRWTMPASTPW
jgi:tetratricopeptide (TPR) repeat protein